MNYRIKNIVGQHFGRLVVIEDSGKRTIGGNVVWRCKCACGNIHNVSSDNLKKRRINSCGCLQKEIASKLGKKAIKHGDYQTRLYKCWEHMKERCLNPHCRSFKYYGARGIGICKAWKEDYLIFKKWALSNGYQDDLTIDRIDRNKNYDPDNCQWIPRSENTRKTFARSKRKGQRGPIVEYGQGILSLASKYREQGVT